jgi:hypothetical protein
VDEINLNSGLDNLFRAYRSACPDPDPSVNFMPELWAKIETRQASTTIFNRLAKGLVTAALGASVIMGLISASYNQPIIANDGSYMQVLAADHVSDLEPFQVERISDLEQ